MILLTKSSCEVIGKSDAGTSGIAIGKTELRCRTIFFLGGGIETRFVDIGISRSEPKPTISRKTQRECDRRSIRSPLMAVNALLFSAFHSIDLFLQILGEVTVVPPLQFWECPVVLGDRTTAFRYAASADHLESNVAPHRW